MAVHIHSPNERTPAHWVATILGIVFLALGVIGFVSPGFMHTHLSPTHNAIHLASGIVSLYLGLVGSAAAARAFCLAFGAVYGLLGVAGMLAGTPGTPTMAGMPADPRLFRVIPGSLELGTMDHAFHIVVSGAYLVAGLMTHAPHSGVSHRDPHHAPLTP